jgi:hypothetical protein
LHSGHTYQDLEQAQFVFDMKIGTRQFLCHQIIMKS